MAGRKEGWEKREIRVIKGLMGEQRYGHGSHAIVSAWRIPQWLAVCLHRVLGWFVCLFVFNLTEFKFISPTDNVAKNSGV